jgi:hypothetical protein
MARVVIAYRSNKTAAQKTLRLLQTSSTDCVAVEIDINDAARFCARWWTGLEGSTSWSTT